MKIIFILILTIYSISTFGQDLKWFKIFSDSADNQLGYYHTTKVDTAGNLIIIGRSAVGEAYITKADSSGNVLWYKKLLAANAVYNTVVDNNNDIIIIGVYKGELHLDGGAILSHNYYIPNYGGEIFIIKYASDGKLKWALSSTTPTDLQFGYSSPPMCHFVDTDCNGNIYTSGGYNQIIYFGNNVLSCDISSSYLLKISPEGKVLFAKNHGNGMPNGLFIAKNFIYSLLYNGGPQISTLYKFDICGNKILEKEIPVNGASLNVKTNNAYYFMSIHKPYLCHYYIGSSYCASSILRYDFDRDTLSEIIRIDAKEFTFEGITPDFNGNLYLYGGNYNIYDSLNLKIGSTEIHKDTCFVIKYNENENSVKWVRYSKFPFQTLSILNTKSVFVTGSFYGPGCAGSVIFNNTRLIVPLSGNTYYLGKHSISDTLGLASYRLFPNCDQNNNSLCVIDDIEQPGYSSDLISISPNPCQDNIYIKGQNVKNISIYNLSGKIEMVECFDGQYDSYSLNMSFLKNGIYILKIFTTGGIITKKVIKTSQY